MQKITDKVGTAIHTCEVESCKIQTDRIKVSIPISALSDDAQKLLDYWLVEEFDYACLDWQDGEIRLYYRTSHHLPTDYDVDELDEEDDDFCYFG